MRKFIILAISLVALAAIAAPFANADVAVTDGVGFVGKGDVQNALGLQNDAELQNLYKSTTPAGAAIEFTYGWTKVYDNMLKYADGTEIHVDHVITGTRAVTAVANTNSQGKVSNGWNLTGTDASTPLTDDGGVATIMNLLIANLATKGMPTQMRINHDSYSTFSMGGLQVNGHDLPNTPAV